MMFQFSYLLDTPDSSFLLCLLAFLACVLLVFSFLLCFCFHRLPFFAHSCCEPNFYDVLACLCHSRACFLLLLLPSVFACSFAFAIEESRTQEVTKPRIPAIHKSRKRKICNEGIKTAEHQEFTPSKNKTNCTCRKQPIKNSLIQ